MGGQFFPEQIKRIASLAFTVLAAILYAGVLGAAIVRTLSGADAAFSSNMVRAAGLLSGLVGSVVTAGFARSEPRRGPQPIRDEPGRTAPPSPGRPARSRSLLYRKLASLANTLGLPLRLSREAPPRSDGDIGLPDSGSGFNAPLWVALLYFGVYFVVGVGAFLTALLKAGAPEIVTNTGWVWLGTAITSAYSFLGLNARQ